MVYHHFKCTGLTCVMGGRVDIATPESIKLVADDVQARLFLLQYAIPSVGYVRAGPPGCARVTCNNNS